jgi:hypothetical protein
LRTASGGRVLFATLTEQKMNRKILKFLYLCLLAIFLAVPGCSWIKKPTQPSLPSNLPPETLEAPAPEEALISLDMDGGFKPRIIQAGKPGQYILQVRNLTGTEQGLTLKDPSGKVLKSWHVGPKATSISNLELPVPGVYLVSGEKRLLFFGGKGAKIQVGQGK